MTKSVTVALAVTIALASSGCSSSHKATIQTSSGAATVTTSQDDKTVTVQSSEGTVSIGQSVDAGKLGAPVYPGAQASQQGSITNISAKGNSIIAAFKTTDAFDKVYEYYKQQMPAGSEKTKISGANGSVAAFQVGDDNAADQVTVQVTTDKPNETDILITHITKTGAAASPAPSST